YVMTERHVTPVFDGSDKIFTVCDENGTDHGYEFIRTLNERDLAKFRRYLTYLRDGLQVKSPDNMRHIKVADPEGLGAEVHELKIHRNGGLRLYIVRYGERWFVTHGAKKPKGNQVPKQAKKAF